MWEINNNLQVLTFLRALIFGIIIIFIYDIFRAFTVNFTLNTKIIFLMDFLFCIVLLPFIFLFLISTTNGQIRGYIFSGILIGVFIWRVTLSRFNSIFFKKLFSIILKFFRFFNIKLNAIFQKFISFFCKKVENITFIMKKSINSLKKVLKKG